MYGADRTTDAIYNDMVQPLLPWAWDGNVGTLFAYGQTGSGKTFSISRLERLVAKSLFDGSLPGERKIYVSIFELAGGSARGKIAAPRATLLECHNYGPSSMGNRNIS